MYNKREREREREMADKYDVYNTLVTSLAWTGFWVTLPGTYH